MGTLLVRWIVIMIAVFLVAWGLPQLGFESFVSYGDDWVTLAIFSAVLALLNTFIRPILALISAPITCLTIGLFALVINTIMFALAAYLTTQFLNRPFEVSGFWGAFIGALAVTVVGVAANFITGGDR